MKKKKQQQGVLEDAVPNIDLKPLVHEHALFFDKLVELIPPRFYLPVDDDKPWFQGLSKAQKAAAKKQARENIKKARRDRLDPDKSATTLDLLKQTIQKNDDADDHEGEDDENLTGLKPMTSAAEEDRSVTYEELRLRLRRRIEELRGNRNNATSERAKKRFEKSEKKGKQQKKRKRDDDSVEEKSTRSGSEDKVDKNVEEAAKELAFSHVKLGNEDGHGKKKRKKLSKLKEFEKAKQLEEAKKDPEKGNAISQKHAWQAATSRASGAKVHDNPKLLKESMKKEKKRHEKNAEKWKGRVETTEKMKAEKQKTRAENIAERIHQKKMRRIEKREKKLMRPGFEGRKEGFINEAST